MTTVVSGLNHHSTPFLTMLVVSGERVPPKVIHVSQAHLTASTMCGMSQQQLVFNSNLSQLSRSPDSNPIIQATLPRQRPSHETADMLAKLDATKRARICESDFLKLFVRCECGHFMTCRAFRDHACFITAQRFIPGRGRRE